MILDIKQIKKKLALVDADIAEFFGYKTKESYYNSARRKHIENGIRQVYSRFIDLHGPIEVSTADILYEIDIKTRLSEIESKVDEIMEIVKKEKI